MCRGAAERSEAHARRNLRADLPLQKESETLRFEVRDDGGGFVLNGKPAGTGLANMRDRIESVGGRLAIESVSGEGTCVSGSVPLH